MRICSKCNKNKPLGEYYKNKLSKGGYNTKCKVCALAFRKEYVKTPKGRANVEKHQAAARAATGAEPERLRREALLTKGFKSCVGCGQDKPLDDFYKSKGKTAGDCKVCHRLRASAYRKTDKGKATQKRKEVRRRNDPKKANKTKAREACRRAVKAGKLLKTPCSCGETEGIEGHHESYAKEDWLKVVWLCGPCHREVHKKAP